MHCRYIEGRGRSAFQQSYAHRKLILIEIGLHHHELHRTVLGSLRGIMHDHLMGHRVGAGSSFTRCFPSELEASELLSKHWKESHAVPTTVPNCVHRTN